MAERYWVLDGYIVLEKPDEKADGLIKSTFHVENMFDVPDNSIEYAIGFTEWVSPDEIDELLKEINPITDSGEIEISDGVGNYTLYKYIDSSLTKIPGWYLSEGVVKYEDWYNVAVTPYQTPYSIKINPKKL